MKSYTFILLIIFLNCVNGVKAEELVIGYFDLAPHIAFNKQTNKTEGILPDFLQNHIAPTMGVTFKFIHMPLARVLRSMKAGKIDGGALFGYTMARAEIYDYPINNFYNMQSVLVVRKNNMLNKIVSIDDIKDMRIGYVTAALITPIMKSKQIKMELMSGTNPWNRRLQMLMSDRLDAVYSPAKANLVYEANKLGATNDIKILSLPEKPSKMFTLFSKASKTSNLPHRYDKAFKKVDGDKLYKAMLLKHIVE